MKQHNPQRQTLTLQHSSQPANMTSSPAWKPQVSPLLCHVVLVTWNTATHDRCHVFPLFGSKIRTNAEWNVCQSPKRKLRGASLVRCSSILDKLPLLTGSHKKDKETFPPSVAHLGGPSSSLPPPPPWRRTASLTASHSSLRSEAHWRDATQCVSRAHWQMQCGSWDSCQLLGCIMNLVKQDITEGTAGCHNSVQNENCRSAFHYTAPQQQQFMRFWMVFWPWQK